MRRFHEYSFYSPLLDCQAARISMVDDHNQEFFAIIAADMPGREFRERRQMACQAIDAAIERGDEPGEVKVNARWVSANG